MKKILIAFIGILIISCHQSKKKETNKALLKVTNKVANFDWLLGEWERLDEEEGKKTYENWKKVNETDYVGIGFTMQNGDTIKQEKIRLFKTNEKWRVTVKVPEEAESVIFKVINYSESEFTCENKEIDFPNKIKYWKNGEKINALISNTEIKIPFEFKKRVK